MSIFTLLKKPVKENLRDNDTHITQDQLDYAYEKIREASQEQVNFLSVASHQLRTPISIARGFTSMFLAGDFGALPNPQVKYLRKINDNLEQLNRVVSKILNCATIDNQNFKLTRERINLYKIILRVIEQLKPKADQKRLAIKTEIPKGIATINLNLDNDKIYEVLANLMDNAISYTSRGSIFIKIKNEENSVLISFTDTGIGIAPEDKEKIFQRFSRAENAKGVRPDGIGIGLYLAKFIVEGHGGKIWFDSELNKGTTFYVQLPK